MKTLLASLALSALLLVGCGGTPAPKAEPKCGKANCTCESCCCNCCGKTKCDCVNCTCCACCTK